MKVENVRHRLITNALPALLVVALLLPFFSTNIFAVDDVPLKVEYTYYTDDEHYSSHLRGERSYSMNSVLRANDRELVNRGLRMAPSCIKQSAYECSHRIEKVREKRSYLYRIKYNFSPRFFNICCYIDGQKVAGAARRYGYSYRQKPISKKGYVFSGWSSSDVKRIVNGSFVMPGHNVTLTGSLVPRNDTPYRVEFYQQDLGKQSYTKIGADTITGEGTTDTRIRDDLNLSALKSKYTGYSLTASSLADNTKIEGDGTSVLKLYYDAVASNVTYKFDGKLPKNTPNLPETAPHIFKSTVPVAEAPSLPGYDFKGWTSDDIELSGGSFIMPDHKVSITGTWIPHANTPYTVEYYQQQLDGTYTLTSTEECKGTTDTKTNPPEKNYVGFKKTDSSKNTESTTTIDGDGSTVLQLLLRPK